MVPHGNVCEIRGTVRGRNGEPIHGARVVVWWQQIRERKELNAGATAEDGTYHLQCEIPEKAPAPPLLVVEARSEQLDGPLFSSLTQAQPTLEIDLELEPRDRSEWTTLARSIEPLLDGLQLSDLVENGTHQDISFLATQLGKSTEVVMRLAMSARLETAFRIPAPAFYAFLCQRVPAALPSPLLAASENFTVIGPLVQRIASLIFGLSPEVQAGALTAAIALDLVGPQFTKQIPQLVGELQALRATDLLHQPYLAGQATPAELLEVAAIHPAKHPVFARALAASNEPMDNFWRTLGDGQHGFTAEEASAIEHAFSVGAFVDHFVPLLQNLKQGFAAGSYRTLPDLARLSLDEWTALVNETGAPPGAVATETATPARVFASSVYNRVTRAFPTAALSSRVATGNFVPEAHKQPLALFFKNNPDLELTRHNIPVYVADQGDKAFAGIAPQDRAAVVTNARNFQRLLHVAPHPDAAQALLGAGITSATQIVAQGHQQFARTAAAAGLARLEADHAFRAAATRYANVVSLYTQFNRDSIGVLPKAIGQVSNGNEAVRLAIHRDQSLATLFGSRDYCATDDCTSILSPAAYLCDLLLWLRNHQQGARTALDVLDSRRPDIRHLLLNCPNTDTELPYIDLVNELLADEISPPIDSISTPYAGEGLLHDALVNHTTYYYIVTAVNALGEGDPSAQVSARPLLHGNRPDEPTGFVATSGDNHVTLSWNAVEGATSYNIYWAPLPVDLTPENGTKITVAASPFIHGGLDDYNDYVAYIVTAVNFWGESKPSYPGTTGRPTEPSTPPPPPAGVSAMPGDTQVTISWNAVPEATSYNIYWATAPEITEATGKKVTLSANSYTHAALVNGATYYYLVKAVNFRGESAPSAQVSATPTSFTKAPSAPAGVSATPGDAQITISWTAVAGATSYNIYWSTLPNVTTTSGTKIAGARNPRWKQTTANKTAADLSAAPEYFNYGAYVKLFGASYPFTLPYSAGLDELRTYLRAWNLPLWQLRQALLPLSASPLALFPGSSANAPLAAIAAERFGIPPHGQDLIVTQSDPQFLPVMWNTGRQDPTSALVPVSPPSSNPSQLAFLTAASITYEQLLELLEVGWVQGTRNPSQLVRIEGISDACDTSTASLSPAPIDAGFLDRAHRFLRLWRATGYTMWELDLLLGAPKVANGTLDEQGLAALLAFRQLQDATGLAVDQQLAFFQDIDTATHRDPDGTTTSLYQKVFLNPTVTWVVPDPDLAFLPTARTVAMGGSSTDGDATPSHIVHPRLSDHLAGIQAAVAVSAADAVLLFGLTDDRLTLANLSLIYRVNALAVASNYSIANLLRLASLLSPRDTRVGVPGAADPMAALNPLFKSPADTLAFLDQAKTIQQSGFSLDALSYLLTPPSAAISGGWLTAIQMTEANIATTLGAIQQSVLNLLSASTTLVSRISDSDTSITVASDVGFPAPNFYAYIGSEILLVTAVGGAKNTTWTVVRGQQGTTAASAASGAKVTPTAGDLDGAVITTVAANASSSTNSPLASDVTALILKNFQVPGTGKTLLSVLEDPALVAPVVPWATITIAGIPVAGDVLQTVLTDSVGHTCTVAHTLTANDSSISQAASAFAQAINDSAAVVGSNAFLARCTASGAAITLTALKPGALESNITSTNTALPGGLSHVSMTPGTTAMISLPAITETSFPEQFRAIRLFDKVGVLCRGLHLVSSDLSWLVANADVYRGLDFTQLPVRYEQPALNLSSLLSTLLLVKLARLWTAIPASSTAQTLYDVIGGIDSGALANEPAAQAALATITGWPLADIQALAAPLDLAFPIDYTRPEAYDRLRILEAMAATAGASGAQIVKWGSSLTDEPAAERVAADVLAALKARQPTNDAWLALAPALMNPLRERRSAALQAWLIAQRDTSGNAIYRDADGLFDYFLIDTQMSSCQLTSRTVQAYVAVQTFVERCLMNLESEVVVDLKADDTWKQWQWMKRYRVWEANREVFLYPENWLIESQRPNRTEIYRTLEQEVHQGQATTDHLETVVLNYIDRLDGLAHLVVTGACQDPASGTIHVVARTPADPPAYYLRSYSNNAWTGWAEIPLGIKALHVIPALHRGRVCLFWLDVKVSNEPRQQTPAMPKEGDAPATPAVDRYVTLGVHFSIFRDGRWAPAQASRGKLFDKPPFDPTSAGEAASVEALYTLKVQTPPITTPLKNALEAVPNGSVSPPFGIGIAANLELPAPPFQVLVDSEMMNVVKVVGPSESQDLGVSPDTSVLLGTSREGGPAHDIGAPVIFPGTISVHDPNLYVEVFRSDPPAGAWHLGRAVFDGRFNGLELSNPRLPGASTKAEDQGKGPDYLLTHAQTTYGPEAQSLQPLIPQDASLAVEWFAGQQPPPLTPQAGAFTTLPVDVDPLRPSTQRVKLPLLITPQKPFRLVGPATDLNLNPANYYFFQDNYRCYWVSGIFHVFYHPFTRLFWHQLAAGGFDLLYDSNLQQNPDSIDPGGADVFSFNAGYRPDPDHVKQAGVFWELEPVTTLQSDIAADVTSITVASDAGVPPPRFSVYIGSEMLLVTAVSGPGNTTWTVVRGQSGTIAAAASKGADVRLDRQFLDFGYGASFSVYNWELFYHVPLYIAQLLSQNQQFEHAQTWFHYIFNPTRQASDPVPRRFWIPKPLRDLCGEQILDQQINKLLEAVNRGDSAARHQVASWRKDPFNPFLLADLRPVSYMKSVVMSYLDNLIAWGDNLFSTESREALGEATLLYVIASEILGPMPVAVTPPQHADESYDQLEPKLDAWANAMVDIENVIGATGSAGNGSVAGVPGPHTFYFKIPPNPKLLRYWTTLADRLYKLRHCQNIAGAALQLALFDAPIDPGLLIAARAAGVDLSSVLSDLAASRPNYRFTALYPHALDFVNAVRAYGASLQAALEKTDAGALVLLQQTTQQQLLTDGGQILDWQVQQAQSNIDALNQTLALAQQKYDFNSSQPFANPFEITGTTLQAAASALRIFSAATAMTGSVAAWVPMFIGGEAGVFGSPVVLTTEGGGNAAKSAQLTGFNQTSLADVLANSAALSNTIGSWWQRKVNSDEAAAEARIQIAQAKIQLAGAQLALQIAQQNQTLHQEQVDNVQKQIDFLNVRFTSDGLYDWMAASLAATYFQSYQLAYQLCKQVERGYQFELGILDSSFIQFGYWDSLHKGLLAGETLNHDLRRLQASYLQQNARRYELSRYVSLDALAPTAPYASCRHQLVAAGACDFTLTESLFDHDYPGHYNRRLTRVGVTVVYPNPGKFDNVKATLTLVANKVRIKTDTSAGYDEHPQGSDPRFLYNYAAVPQKIATGNAQDDPGLFVTAIAANLADQRYLPFENAGAISTWHLEMPQSNNEVDLSTITDVVLHLHYTAHDGGDGFRGVVQAFNKANLPKSGIKVFSALNDFAAPSPTAADPTPPTPWQAFLAPAGTANPTLTVTILPSKFPVWTRGKTITVTSLTVLAVAWPPGRFTLKSPLYPGTGPLLMSPVSGPTEGSPCVSAAQPFTPSTASLGHAWTFELQREGAGDGRPLTHDEIGDVLLLLSYDVS